MTTRNLFLAGTIIAGPLLSLTLPSLVARAESGPAIRLAQAEPGGPGERREPRGGPPPREAPPQPREAPPQREAPRAAPPAAPAPQAQPPRAEPPRAEPPHAEPPRAEPPRERPQAAPERREAPQPPREPPRTEPPRSVTPPPAARPEARPETTPQPRPTAPSSQPPAAQTRPEARPEARPDSTPIQRPTAPPVPHSATQPRPDLGASPQPQTAPGTPPSLRPTTPDATGLAPQRPRVEERDGRTYLRQNDNRLIIREGGRDIIRHDEVERLRRGARDVDVQQRPNGRREIVILQPDGDRIVSIVDADGSLLRRERRARDGRIYVLIENDVDRPRGGFYRPVELPPLRLSIPRERYIVEAEDAPFDVIEETLMAPPVERVERAYSLDEVRYNQRLRQKMSRVDIDTINFAFGAAEVDPNGAARLDAIARALLDVTRRNPNEVFLIEGHTDAVGGDTENLTLSDRRAESVAAILTERYQIPAENLVTQGYGEQFLKVQTQAPERQNRRVTVRRITPLLQQGENQAPPR